jgi:sulfatase modifying factor 1
MTTPTPTRRLATLALLLAVGLTAVIGARPVQAQTPTPVPAQAPAPAASAGSTASSATTAALADQRNSLGMSFVSVPAGEFWMGNGDSPAALAAAFPSIDASRINGLGDESPRHLVRITRPFELGQFEVTVGQFRAFLQASGHVPESIADGTGGYGYNPDYDPATTVRHDAFEGRHPRYSWANPGFAQSDAHPVTNVTWRDAQAMAQWLSRSEGRVYRLPTEAEWEYAARAGTTTRYPNGDPPESLLGSANVFAAETAQLWPQWQAQSLSLPDGQRFTAPVGSFAPNAWGLYDMIGNVWEWCADWHDDTYYASSPRDDPQGPPDGDVRVRRGGSWHTWPFYDRVSFRNWNSPETRYVLLGLRLLREAP